MSKLKTFYGSIREIRIYRVTVQAKDAEIAREKVADLFCSWSPDDDADHLDPNVEVTVQVEEARQ